MSYGPGKTGPTPKTNKVKYVTTRHGKREQFDGSKVLHHLEILRVHSTELKNVDVKLVVEKVIQGLPEHMTTKELDNLVAETAASMVQKHIEYGTLASRVEVVNLHKETPPTFFGAMHKLYNNFNHTTNEVAPLISEELWQLVCNHEERIEKVIAYSRDYNYDYFGLKTLERSYLIRTSDKQIVERPQHMLMRVSLGIHGANLDYAFKTYRLMSKQWYTHATPTLFNSGTPRQQNSSCYLVTVTDDSIDGIYTTLKQCAMLSKYAGGVGLAIHNIRASHTYIKGTNGTSNGVVPMLRVFNDTSRYVDQGGGKRKGAFAIYLEPWHSDVFEYLDLKLPHGKEEFRARDLFYALWIPDLFMKRVEANANWALFSPNEAPGLCDTWGDEFEALYTKYEQDPSKVRRVVKAQELWIKMLEAQILTGTPYILFKDACNRKSNQQNLGTIRSSNLCTEIIQFTSPNEIAVCNLASIALPKFVNDGDTRQFDHEKLYKVVYHIALSLDRIIDINFYPVEEAKTSNLKHRPMGIGVQGLADAFILMRYPFESDQAKQLNKEIFETIYYAALCASCDLAKKHGPCASFEGSPASKGILQYDMWNVTPSPRWNWTELKERIFQYKLRNSLFVAPMPTASTSQILGNNESFEPYTTNIYSRAVLSGEFSVLNKHLFRDLEKLGLLTNEIKNRIIADRGSVQNITEIPEEIRELYKTVWEMKGRTLIDMAADRGAFIDQSQSFNCFMAEPTYNKLTSYHFYAWKKGLKTGMYYLRARPVVNPIQFTVNQKALGHRFAPNRGRSDEKEIAMSEAAFSHMINHLAEIEGDTNNRGAAAGAAAVVVPIEGEICRMEEGCLVCSS